MKQDQLKKGPANKYSAKKRPPPKIKDTRKRNYDLVGLVIMILLGIIIYSNSFDCSFHLDDYYVIVDNLIIRNFSDVKALWNFSPSRPVAVFTFALNYHFNQLDVRYWHLFNLVIHLVNACLVWGLTLLIFSSPAMKDHKIAEHKKIIALLTALLFVSHPLATQSVTYIVQRMTSMAAMFYLLSLSLYIKARITDKGNISRILLFAGSFISAVLAMLTKENAFTLPFAILLVEFSFIRTKKPSINFKDYKMILVLAAFLGMISIVLFKYSFSIFNPIPTGSHGITVTPFNYLITQFSVIVKYLQLLLLPINQTVDYDFPVANNIFGARTILSFLVLLFLIILAVFLFKKQRVISFGIFWFFLTLSIESSIIPISDVIFEHRTYLPSFGFFLILSSGLFTLFGEKYKTWAIAVLVIIITSNSYATFERNKVWKDDLTFWNDNVMKSPNKARPITSRGTAYEKLDQWDKALNDFTKAIQVDPQYQLAWANRGFAYRNLGQYDKAIDSYTKALEIDPGDGLSWSNRGVTYDKLGQLDKAIADYSRAIEINPGSTDPYSNRSAAYGKLGQWDKAIADVNKAIELNPGKSNAYSNRGNIYSSLNQPDKAIADYSKAVELDPGFTEGYSNRAALYGESGQWGKAIADYTQIINLVTDYSTGYYDRGLAYGNLGQWDKAIADYSSAIRINPNFKQAFVNRGDAYGKLGQWEKALDDFTSALNIDPNFTIAYTNREISLKNLKRKKGE